MKKNQRFFDHFKYLRPSFKYVGYCKFFNYRFKTLTILAIERELLG